MTNRWTPDKDLLLLLKVIEAHPIPSINAEKIHSSWPATAGSTTPSPRAIRNRIRSLQNNTAIKTESVNTPTKSGIGIGKGKGKSKPGKEKWKVNLEEEDDDEEDVSGIEIKEEEEEKEEKKIKIEEITVQEKREEDIEEIGVGNPAPVATTVTPPRTPRKRKGRVTPKEAGLQGWQETTTSANAAAERIKRRRGAGGGNGIHAAVSDDDEDLLLDVE